MNFVLNVKPYKFIQNESQEEESSLKWRWMEILQNRIPSDQVQLQIRNTKVGHQRKLLEEPPRSKDCRLQSGSVFLCWRSNSRRVEPVACSSHLHLSPDL